MYPKTVLPFLALAVLVQSHDLNVGLNSGRKIFDEKREASPALWRQIQNVTISTNGSEVISGVIVKDLREDKDGDVKIVDGGEGQTNVTIELKSPTVLRGYDFQIQVYAVPEQSYVKNTDVNVPIQVGTDNWNKALEPNFEQPRTNFDGTNITKLPESSTQSTRRVRNPESIAPKNLDNASRRIPTVAAHENDTLAVVKELENRTPKINLSGEENATVNNNEARKNKDGIENNLSNVFNANLPPNMVNRTIANATVPMDRDLSLNNEQDRRVRDTDSEVVKPEQKGHPSNAGRNTPVSKNSEHHFGGNLTPEGRDVSVLPLKPNKDRTTDEVDGRQLDNYGESGIPRNIGAVNENKTPIDTKNDSKVHNETLLKDDKDFPTFALNVDTTKMTTAKPRHTRDTKVQDTKNLPKPFVYQVQETTTAPWKLPEDKIVAFATPIGPKSIDIDSQASSSAPESKTSSTTMKSQAKEIDESLDYSGDDLKAMPLSVTMGKQNLAGLHAKKPVISIE